MSDGTHGRSVGRQRERRGRVSRHCRVVKCVSPPNNLLYFWWHIRWHLQDLQGSGAQLNWKHNTAYPGQRSCFVRWPAGSIRVPARHHVVIPYLPGACPLRRTTELFRPELFRPLTASWLTCRINIAYPRGRSCLVRWPAGGIRLPPRHHVVITYLPGACPLRRTTELFRPELFRPLTARWLTCRINIAYSGRRSCFVR